MSEGQNQRPLNFKIWNNTWNTTLKLYKFKGDQMFPDFKPELPPGSSDSCFIFSNPDFQYFRCHLVYEAESFSLAVFAYIPPNSYNFFKVLHLELSLDKAHLGDFDGDFSSLVQEQDNPHADKTTVAHGTFDSTVLGRVELRAGPYRVVAEITAVGIEMKLEERGNPRESCTIL